jgi:hypothetical protein
MRGEPVSFLRRIASPLLRRAAGVPPPRRRRSTRPTVEVMEERSLLAITINFVPVGSFFASHPQAMDVLQSAASQITQRVNNQLVAIPGLTHHNG